MPAHTPGPWRVVTRNAHREFWSASIRGKQDGRQVVVASAPFHYHGFGAANAALIAAAPDMLAALVLAREFISTDRNSLADCSIEPDGSMEPDDQAALDDYDAALLQIDAAIHKATGSAA